MNEVKQPTERPAEDLLYEAACVASRAPSIVNSQPWRWRVSGDTLELRADRSRQLTVADPQGRLMILSCGAALHHATVVLSVLGADATLDRLYDRTDPDLLARLTLTGTHYVTVEDMQWHHALRTRRTDRRPFLGSRPLSAEVLELLHKAAQPFDVATRVFDPAELGFLALAAKSAAIIEQRDPAYLDEIMAWTTNRDPSSRDGVPATVAVAQVARTVAVRDLAPGTEPGLHAGHGDDRYTTYMAFATNRDTRVDWLRTGEAVSAVLLAATANGVASSVMSDVVEVAGARALLSAVVKPAGYPQLTVRLGVNGSPTAVPSTPRRPCTEIITVAGAE